MEIYLRDLNKGIRDENIAYLYRQAEAGNRQALKITKAYEKGDFNIIIGKMDEYKFWSIED